MPDNDKREPDSERAARERGRSIPHYAGKVTKELAKPARRRKLTPSKRAS